MVFDKKTAVTMTRTVATRAKAALAAIGKNLASRRGGHRRVDCPPERGRRALVDSGKYRIETAQAAKACGERIAVIGR
jgi:hypothetical protein